MKVAIITFTALACDLGQKIVSRLDKWEQVESDLCRCGSGGLDRWTRDHFSSHDVLLFVGATGIAVRAIAPYIRNKVSDPAVVVVDELGKYVIPVLSGHIGGANRFARRLAGELSATPVITTATDLTGAFAVDSWASENGLKILNTERIKAVSSKLLAGRKVYMRCDFPVVGELPDGVVLDVSRYEVALTAERHDTDEVLALVPPVLTVGIGCRRGADEEQVRQAFETAMEESGYLKEAVCRVCSIDIKADEAGIIKFCEDNGLEFKTFSKEELKSVEGEFSSSQFVKSVTGVENVCERSAVLGSGGRLVLSKRSQNGVCVAIAISEYSAYFK